MSQQNVDAFRRAVEANNRGDYDALLEEIDPDIEWRAVFQVKFGGQATTCRGHEGVREYLQPWTRVSPSGAWRFRRFATSASESSQPATFEAVEG